MTYGATIISVRVPDRAGRVDDVVLGFDQLDDYLTKGALLRLHRRPLRQPDRRRPVHARRRRDPARHQQRTEPPARRRPGVRQGRLEGRTVRPRRQQRRQVHLHQRRRRRGLPGHAARRRQLYAHAAQRARPGVLGDDRQGDADQPDQPQLLQPGGPRPRRHPAASADAARGSLHADRRDADPDRRDRAGGRHAVRLPNAGRDRRADRRRQRADPPRQRLRPQLRDRRMVGRRHDAAGRARRRSGERTHARRRDDRAGRPVLRRQQPRRRAQRLRPPYRVLPRDAALPRFAEPSELPVDDSSGPAHRTGRRPSTRLE